MHLGRSDTQAVAEFLAVAADVVDLVGQRRQAIRLVAAQVRNAS